MKKNKLKLIVAVIAVIPLLALANLALASTVSGTLTTGIGGTNGTTINGTVIVAPTAAPVAGTYPATQNVVLTANGSSGIHYTTDGTVPTCSTGTLYSGAVSVSSSKVITAISCYPQNNYSSVVTFGYAIVPVSTNGGGGAGIPAAALPATANTVWDSTNVGISDLSILMSEWGQAGTGLSADLNNDGTVDIMDFSILMADWNGQ